MPDQAKQHPRLIRSFGRIKSRKLSDHKKWLLANLLGQYEITDADSLNADLAIITTPYRKIYLEIGFGFGDFLFANAKLNPDILYIGGETHLNGIVNLLGKLENRQLNNIRIFKSDIRLLLTKISDNFFDKIYILFPDPWPKSKHYRRRLINENFVEILAVKLKKNGELIVASDHPDYQKSILVEFSKNKNFSLVENLELNSENQPPDWVETKYQIKAEKEGRKSFYFRFQKLLTVPKFPI